MSPATRWGLSPPDSHAHTIDELAHHPIGVYVACRGHRLMMLTPLLMFTPLRESPPSQICLSCARWADQ